MVPIGCIPDSDGHVVTSSKEDVSIFNYASYGVFVPNHGAEVEAIFSSVHLDFLGVTADHEVAIVLALCFVLVEMDAEHFCSFVAIEQFALLGVVNAMAVLWFDGGALISRAIFTHRRVDIPDGDGAIVTSCYQVLVALFNDTNYATDGVSMLIFWRFQKYTTADVKIPKSY